MPMPGFLQSDKPRREYVEGRLIVRVKEDAVRPGIGAARLVMNAATAAKLPTAVADPLEYLRKNAGLKSVLPFFSKRMSSLGRARTTRANLSRLAVMSSVADSENEDLRGLNMLNLNPKEVTSSLIQRLKRNRAVEYVERMPARWIQATPGAAPSALSLDPRTSLQWGLNAIGWFATPIPDASDIAVAVFDTGIDTTHPALKDVPIDYHRKGLSKVDVLGHGTHVSGTIAATTSQDDTFAGVAGAKLAVWKIFTDEPNPDDFYVDDVRYLRALNEVRDSGARVLNLSIGGPMSSNTEQILFRRLNTAGIFVAAAMGNEFQRGNRTSFPAAYDGVTAVGAVSSDMRQAPFSNTGSHATLAAPGVSILSTLPVRKSKYRTETTVASWDGTSMATPHVSGMAALILARHPDWTPAEVQQRLIASTRKLPDMGGHGWTEVFGFGLPYLPEALQ